MQLRQRIATVALTVVLASAAAHGQPWDQFVDPVSGVICDVVNAGNLEFVVFSDTGEVVVVTGEDYAFLEPFVDENGVYFFDGPPEGTIEFAEDGDGFPTLWLLAADGTVLDLDPDTGEPIYTGLFPFEFVGAPCDAFDLWDDDDFDGVPDDFDFCPETPEHEPVDEDGCACFEVDSDGDGLDDCVDECPFDFGEDEFGCPCGAFDDDLDGVDNCFDLCPGTPLNTFVTEDGCPCVEFDEDDDGINDCFDDCPNTPFGEAVDDDGCEIVVVVPPPIFIGCGNLTNLTMISTLCGLVGLRFVSRRRPLRIETVSL